MLLTGGHGRALAGGVSWGWDARPGAADGGGWWLVPKSGRPGHVEPGAVTEVAPTAGLSQTSSVSAAKDWSGIRLVTPKAARSRR